MNEQIIYRSLGGVLYASTYDPDTRTGHITCIQPRPMPARVTEQPVSPETPRSETT